MAPDEVCEHDMLVLVLRPYRANRKLAWLRGQISTSSLPKTAERCVCISADPREFPSGGDGRRIRFTYCLSNTATDVNALPSVPVPFVVEVIVLPSFETTV